MFRTNPLTIGHQNRTPEFLKNVEIPLRMRKLSWNKLG